MKLKITILITFFLLPYIPIAAYSQETDTSAYLPNVIIDEVVISNNDNFKVEDFIRMVKNDTTFYKAFKSLHLATYNAENDIKVFDKKGKKIQASLQS